MIKVYLVCGHVYETGFITETEKTTHLTVCPKCRREVKIVKAVERAHPAARSKRWVDGAEIKIGGGKVQEAAGS